MEQIALDWGAEPDLFSVSELTQAMRGLLVEHFTDIWVAGEISGTRVPASGHYYFTLKDETAQLRCVCYKMTARYLKFKPQDGIAVIARGRIDFYDARGEVQLIVETIRAAGSRRASARLRAIEKEAGRRRTFRRIHASARFRRCRARIGIVTSPTGAVIRDILQILERRFPGRPLRIYPAQVQGEGSVEQVVAGIEYFSESEWADVVIVARGGGSLEDLWTFNEERVARAIAASAVPVISAVGHETDFTIADFVADLRAPTPSAAAELVICTRQSVDDRIHAAEIKLRQAMRLNIALLARRLHRVAVDQARLHRAIGKQMQRVDELDYALRDRWRASVDTRHKTLDAVSLRLRQLDVRLRFQRARSRLEALEASAVQAMKLRLSAARGELGPLEAHLEQLGPLKILERGYAIVSARGKIVKSPEDAPPGSEAAVRLARGELQVKVL